MSEEILTEDEKFWGPRYGKIYPYLEQAKPYHNLISQIGDFIDPKANERWLDLGTGSGAIVDLIWRLTNGTVGEVCALDLTDVMLNHLRRRLPSFDPPVQDGQIVFMKHNLAYRLPFPNEAYDGIVANLVLPYIEQHEGVKGRDALESILRESYRVLKPGGVCVWSSPVHCVKFFNVFLASWKEIMNPKRIKNLYYGPAILRYAKMIEKKGTLGQYTFLHDDELIRIMQKVGFSDIKTARSFAGQAVVVSGTKV